MDENAFNRGLLPHCDIVVAWLRGDLDELPHHPAPPAAETQLIIEDLVIINQAGLLTLNSQPGTDDQRAYLCVLTSPRVARHLATAARSAGMLADHWPLAEPPQHRGPMLVTRGTSESRVTMPAGTRYQDATGGPAVVTEQAECAAGAARDVIELSDDPTLFAQGQLVTVAAPRWGPNERLWGAVRDAIASLP